MATYLLLSSLTDEGRRTLKQRPERLQEVNHELEQLGGRITQQFAILGRYDFVSVVEAPDNETITRISVELGSRGTIRLTTLAAFPTQPLDQSQGGRSGDRDSGFVVFTKLTADGQRSLQQDTGRLGEIEAEARRLGATITHQYRVLGEYDFITFVKASDNTTAARIATEVSSLGTVRLNVYPAIALERFLSVLQRKSYRTEPHAWQTDLWARAVRRAGRRWVMTRHINHFCRPLRVEGRDDLRSFSGPAIIIANHTSHFDTPVVLAALPERLRARTTVAAAADRFYRANKRTWWYSLFWNTFPIARGGGKAALDYPMSLLKRGWSILIYPEGGRSKPGPVQRFHHGVTIMAMQARTPVIPVYLSGLAEVMPKGHRTPQPGPVSVRVGQPVSLEGVTDVPEGTTLLENTMRALAGLARS